MTTEFFFGDFETRSPVDLITEGGYRYTRHLDTDVLCLGGLYGFDNEPDNQLLWSPYHYWHKRAAREDEQLERLLDHINDGHYFVAWNANFDRNVWNFVATRLFRWPELKLDQVLCAQAQAEANNLPGKLEKAAECLGTRHKKDPKGKQLIDLLSKGVRATWKREFETPARMGHMRSYCLSDCFAMRDVWTAVRPLTVQEWREYHASERINDRGVEVDVEFAEAAVRYARDEEADVNQRLAELTNDTLMTVTNHTRKSRWMHDQLWPDEELQSLTEKPPKDGKERYTLDRPTRETLLDLLSNPTHAERFEPNHLDTLINVIETIEAGNSAAVRKFTTLCNTALDGRLRGQYSFSGAGQTGRFSSRGVQIHNVIRDPLDPDNADRAIDAMEDVVAGRSAEQLTRTYRYPISRLLARLIRPTFVAKEGSVLVWADYDQVEARVLPWLANSRGAERVLDVFRAGEDIYITAASGIFTTTPDAIDKVQRQIGKVATLALGFGGAAGAFNAMGRNYGVILSNDIVQTVVYNWRNANQWCVNFWHQLWEAAIGAYEHPNTWMPAGRVRYAFLPNLMRGTLVCELPCGRWLVYPQFKREWVLKKNKTTGEEYEGWRTSFVKGYGNGGARTDLWYGILAENITQGFAASLLRKALCTIDDVTVLHTHDESVAEVPEEDENYWLEELPLCMTEFESIDVSGLPLTATAESGPFYTK